MPRIRKKKPKIKNPLDIEDWLYLLSFDKKDKDFGNHLISFFTALGLYFQERHLYSGEKREEITEFVEKLFAYLGE